MYHQQVVFDEEDDFDHNACNMEQVEDSVSLRRPSEEEIARLTEEMAAQMRSSLQLGNRTMGGE